MDIQASNKNTELIKVDIQISSNMRIAIGLKEEDFNPKYTIGEDTNLNFLTESHIISFERYVHPPPEIRALKKKIDYKKAKNNTEIESANPWLITDIDYSGNILVKSNKD